MRSPITPFVIALSLASTVKAEVCQGDLIKAHIVEQAKAIAGDLSGLDAFLDRLRNEYLIPAIEAPEYEFYCSTVLINLSIATNLVSHMPTDLSAAVGKLHALKAYDALRSEYRHLLQNLIEHEGASDQLATDLRDLIDRIDDKAVEIVRGHTTSNILALDSAHAEKPVYRLIYRTEGIVKILEASFGDEGLLQTTRDLDEFAQPDANILHDSIALELNSITGRWQTWADGRGMEARFGQPRDQIAFGDGGYVLPLRWRVRSTDHSPRRDAVQALREALFTFIDPKRYEPEVAAVVETEAEAEPEPDPTTEPESPQNPEQTPPPDADPGPIEVMVDAPTPAGPPSGELQAGDCIKYLSDANDLYVYVGPDTSSPNTLIPRAVSTTAFLTLGPIEPPVAGSNTDMEINQGRITLFRGYSATAWVNAEDSEGFGGYLVYANRLPGDQVEVVRFERVECDE